MKVFNVTLEKKDDIYSFSLFADSDAEAIKTARWQVEKDFPDLNLNGATVYINEAKTDTPIISLSYRTY
jgi:hypothetical protein